MRGFFILLLGLSLLSCKKEKTLLEQTWERCWDDMQFTCDGIRGEFFFSGTINDQSFCVSTFPGDYEMENRVWTITFTPAEDPSFMPGQPFAYSYLNFVMSPPVVYVVGNGEVFPEEFFPTVSLGTPVIEDSIIHPLEDYLTFVKPGDLPLCTGESLSSDCLANTFRFNIHWFCFTTADPSESIDPYNIYKTIPAATPDLTPGYVRQKPIFRVTEFQIDETPFSKIYNITFEIECDLVYKSGFDIKLFGRLEDGVFKTQVVIPK